MDLLYDTSSSSTSTPPEKTKVGSSRCFIATAAYGSETAAELDTLRAFRDEVLLESKPGQLLVDTYYRVSPPLAEFIAEREDIRTFVREAWLNPVVTVLKGTQEIWGGR